MAPGEERLDGTANLDDYGRQFAPTPFPNPVVNNFLANPSDRLVTKFHRLNEVVEISRKDRMNGDFKEPLDEMRIEVAEWLNN